MTQYNDIHSYTIEYNTLQYNTNWIDIIWYNIMWYNDTIVFDDMLRFDIIYDIYHCDR